MAVTTVDDKRLKELAQSTAFSGVLVVTVDDVQDNWVQLSFSLDTPEGERIVYIGTVILRKKDNVRLDGIEKAFTIADCWEAYDEKQTPETPETE